MAWRMSPSERRSARISAMRSAMGLGMESKSTLPPAARRVNYKSGIQFNAQTYARQTTCAQPNGAEPCAHCKP
jgi:hypothetical protein